jgi:hypothetical protein
MMITDVDDLYFKWLMESLEAPTRSLGRLGWMLHNNTFTRSVGNDSNRAAEGIRLRQQFFRDYQDANISPRKMNLLMAQECSWFEMLIALCEALDYIYEGGVQGRLLELIDNLGLSQILKPPNDSRYDEVDQELVDLATTRVDHNLFDAKGHGGLFPLRKSGHPDQREVEIWEQHAAYFSEKLEGVVWTSTS